MADKSSKSLIEQMLNKTPEVRLGGSYSSIKKNAWFKGFDFVVPFNSLSQERPFGKIIEKPTCAK
jgi:hypothetical protein